MIEAFSRCITTINEQIGKWVSLLFLPLIFSVMYEVIARQFFNAPTIWSWDVALYLAATAAVLGGGYCLIYKGAHIVLDIVYVLFSARIKATLDLLTSSVFFLGLGILLWLSIVRAEKSIALWEITDTVFRELVWPLKIIIVIGIVLLLLQGIVKFRQDLQIATGRVKGKGV